MKNLMENSNTLKREINYYYIEILDEYLKDIDKDNDEYNKQYKGGRLDPVICILNLIFNSYENGNSNYFDNEVFELVTQKKIVEIIKSIIYIYVYSDDIIVAGDYFNRAKLLSCLYFIIDYAENHEVNENIKKFLQGCKTNIFIKIAIKKLYKYKKTCTIDYLNEYNHMLKLTKNIPLSHDWWKRD